MFEQLKNKKYYTELFNSWIPSVIHIDNDHCIWKLQSPNYKNQFISMYQDGYTLLIYGDYGSLVFDNMTWIGSPENLSYDNLDYQMEKLSHDCRNAINVFDEQKCRDDIITWFKYYYDCCNYSLEDEIYDKIIDFLKEPDFLFFDIFQEKLYNEIKGKYGNDDAEEYIDVIQEMHDVFVFVLNALEHVDEFEWISWLRTSNLDDFEDPYGSALWNAGKCIDQKFYINLYAMYILSEKLKENNRKEN